MDHNGCFQVFLKTWAGTKRMIKLEKFVSVARCWCYLRHTTRTFDLPMERKACLWIIYVTMPYASGRLLLFSFKAGAHPFVHHSHCVFLQICLATVNSCCLRLPASSSFRLSLISWCRSSFMWQYHKSIRWVAFLRMESMCCLGMKLISITLSSQDCPHPAKTKLLIDVQVFFWVFRCGKFPISEQQQEEIDMLGMIGFQVRNVRNDEPRN